MIGLSTIGSISLGCALVAGRNRVPSPAAGKTAFRTLAGIYYSLAPISACWQPVRPAFVHAGLFPALSALMALLTRTARAAGTLGWRVRLFRIREVAVTVPIVVANPRDSVRQVVFIGAFRREAEEVMCQA